jgi:hypothetical protein
VAIDVTFLEEGGQAPPEVAALLAEFIAARATSPVAVYDFRLGDPVAGPVVRALRERAAAGVEVLLAYDAGKPHADFPAAGTDPAPPGTADFVRRLGLDAGREERLRWASSSRSAVRGRWSGRSARPPRSSTMRVAAGTDC